MRFELNLDRREKVLEEECNLYHNSPYIENYYYIQKNHKPYFEVKSHKSVVPVFEPSKNLFKYYTAAS